MSRINESWYTSTTDEWATPQALFEELDSEFHFVLDACATEQNAKVCNYYDKQTDGLKQSWNLGGAVWCNPPYGKHISEWIEKAYNENKQGVTVVLLLPARTDTKYFHKYIYNQHEIRFIKGRLKYNDGNGTAPFPSMIVVMRGDKHERFTNNTR